MGMAKKPVPMNWLFASSEKVYAEFSKPRSGIANEEYVIDAHFDTGCIAAITFRVSAGSGN